MPRKVPQAEQRHPIKAEKTARIEYCRQLVAAGHYDGEVKRLAAEEFKISTRSVERYLKRARELILAESEKPKTEHRATSLAFYQKVVANENEETRNRLRAQQRIDELLALELPKTINLQHSGNPDNPTPIPHADATPIDEQRSGIAILLAALRRRGGHTSVPESPVGSPPNGTAGSGVMGGGIPPTSTNDS